LYRRLLENKKVYGAYKRKEEEGIRRNWKEAEKINLPQVFQIWALGSITFRLLGSGSNLKFYGSGKYYVTI
jgi:hypothetical protein